MRSGPNKSSRLDKAEVVMYDWGAKENRSRQNFRVGTPNGMPITAQKKLLRKHNAVQWNLDHKETSTKYTQGNDGREHA